MAYNKGVHPCQKRIRTTQDRDRAAGHWFTYKTHSAGTYRDIPVVYSGAMLSKQLNQFCMLGPACVEYGRDSLFLKQTVTNTNRSTAVGATQRPTPSAEETQGRNSQNHGALCDCTNIRKVDIGAMLQECVNAIREAHLTSDAQGGVPRILRLE